MRVPHYNIGVKGDECQCGRRATVRHCPSCGSSRTYARARRLHKFMNGEEKYVEVQFRCMTCGHLYIDEEREFCEAPPIGTPLAAQKARVIMEAKQKGEYLRPSEERLVKTLQELSTPTQTPEQQKLAREHLEHSIRGVWADMRFAHIEGKGPDPGPCEAFVAREMLKYSSSSEQSAEAKNVEG